MLSFREDTPSRQLVNREGGQSVASLDSFVIYGHGHSSSRLLGETFFPLIAQPSRLSFRRGSLHPGSVLLPMKP